MSRKPIHQHWSSSSSQSQEILLQPQDSRTDQQRYIPSPTLSYYAHYIPATPAPPVPPLPQLAVPRRLNAKPKPAPIDMARIRRASSRRPPKVVVTCDVEGLMEEDERTGHVEVTRPVVDVVSVRSSRASVGDMRIPSNIDKVSPRNRYL